jgi:hypothetical protein
MKSKYLCVLAVVPIALLGFGCGGDDAPTQEEYVAQADEICKEADEALNVVIEDTFGTRQPNQQEIISFTGDEVIPNIEGQIEDLRALTPPEGDEETVNAIYDSLKAGIAAVADDPAGSIQEAPPEIEEAGRLAREYGMEECGSG